jgi:hypothetical protein
MSWPVLNILLALQTALSGRDYNGLISQKGTLRGDLSSSFQATIDAGVESVMCYTTYDGVTIIESYLMTFCEKLT